MNGNAFERYEEQHNRRQYAKTMEALEAYTNKSLKYSEDLAPPLFADPMANPVIQEANNFAEGATEIKRMVFAEEVKEVVRQTRFLKSNLATIHTVIWGHCSEDMKSKVKTHVGYKEKVAILQGKLIHNGPVTPDDANRALIIYGPEVLHLKKDAME